MLERKLCVPEIVKNFSIRGIEQFGGAGFDGIVVNRKPFRETLLLEEEA